MLVVNYLGMLNIFFTDNDSNFSGFTSDHYEEQRAKIRDER